MYLITIEIGIFKILQNYRSRKPDVFLKEIIKLNFIVNLYDLSYQNTSFNKYELAFL